MRERQGKKVIDYRWQKRHHSPWGSYGQNQRPKEMIGSQKKTSLATNVSAETGFDAINQRLAWPTTGSHEKKEKIVAARAGLR